MDILVQNWPWWCNNGVSIILILCLFIWRWRPFVRSRLDSPSEAGNGSVVHWCSGPRAGNDDSNDDATARWPSPANAMIRFDAGDLSRMSPSLTHDNGNATINWSRINLSDLSPSEDDDQATISCCFLVTIWSALPDECVWAFDVTTGLEWDDWVILSDAWTTDSPLQKIIEIASQ